MNKKIDLYLVRQAQAGCQKSLSEVSELSMECVQVYIYRLTLDYHLAEDLTQETILEMTKSLKRLHFTHVNFFWAWLYRTALGKVQHHFRIQGNKRMDQRTIVDIDKLKQIAQQDNTGINKMIKDELKQAVSEAMSALKLSYRSILILRCFEQLSFAQIASITGQSELHSRVQFFRAKKSLEKQLSHRGFKHEHLVPALGAFAAITLTPGTKASAAALINPAAVQVSTTTAMIATACTKVGVSSIIAAVLGIVILTNVINKEAQSIRQSRQTRNSQYAQNSLNQLRAAPRDARFQYPVRISALNDAGADGWQMCISVNPTATISPIVPEEIMTGTRSMNDGRLLILSQGDWIELDFGGPIVDEDGPDIFFDARITGEMPLVYVTDTSGQEALLPSPIRAAVMAGFTLNGYDLSDVNLDFVPRAIRIQSQDNAPPVGGLQLWVVRARVSQ